MAGCGGLGRRSLGWLVILGLCVAGVYGKSGTQSGGSVEASVVPVGLIGGEWNSTTVVVDREGRRGEGRGNYAQWLASPQALSGGRILGMMTDFKSGGEQTGKRRLMVTFATGSSGEVLVADQEGGEEDDEEEKWGEFQAIFAFDFEKLQTGAFLSTGEFLDGASKGIYTFFVMPEQGATLSFTNSDSGEMVTTLFDRVQVHQPPVPLWKQYGASACLIIAFVGSKVMRTYMANKQARTPGTTASASATRPSSARKTN